MNALRIGIAGTRGIPNNYGGFEQVAASLADGLVNAGHDVTVYNTNDHLWQNPKWKGVNIVHCFCPNWMGTAGQFIYDLNCIRHARRQSYDMLLLLGYTSSSVWGRFFPRNTLIITNMDGWEWKRSKYPAMVRRFLLHAEGLAAKYSDHMVADSPVIHRYLSEKYKTPATYIAYGAEEITQENLAVLQRYKLESKRYCMLMARMEPENNIGAILEGICATRQQWPIIVIGNTATPYGKEMRQRFSADKRVLFAGAVFDQVDVHTLRRHALLYFHGHSVGGTNPSLLEAMASGAPVCAHDNPFNRSILGEDAVYFSKPADVTNACENAVYNEQQIASNKGKIRNCYNWKAVVAGYEKLFLELHNNRK